MDFKCLESSKLRVLSIVLGFIGVTFISGIFDYKFVWGRGL